MAHPKMCLKAIQLVRGYTAEILQMNAISILSRSEGHFFPFQMKNTLLWYFLRCGEYKTFDMLVGIEENHFRTLPNDPIVSLSDCCNTV